MNKRELKSIVKFALIREYGYAPKDCEITILENNSDGQWIRFGVGGYEYNWDSFTLEKRVRG